MKIIVINGNPDKKNHQFDDFLENISDSLKSYSHVVTIFNLKNMNLKYCTGCFCCWTKLPGECIIKDDSKQIRFNYINSDLVIYASPVLTGFTSALLKKLQDKIIPLIHPFFVYDRGEVHHLSRYEKYPLMGLLLEKMPDSDDEDIENITKIYERFAINLKSKLCFVKFTNSKKKDIINEINSL